MFKSSLNPTTFKKRLTPHPVVPDLCLWGREIGITRRSRIKVANFFFNFVHF